MKNKSSLVLALLILAATAGCRQKITALRVAYCPNLTHAPMVVGVAMNRFGTAAGIPIQPSVYNAGPAAIDALLYHNVDVVYAGPVPAISAFTRSKGDYVIVSGVAQGGAALVVSKRSGFKTVADLRSAQVATPQIGNTQDVAARRYFGELGFVSYEHGGSFYIVPAANPDLLSMFQSDRVQAAWTVEPWVSQLVVEGGAKMLVDEAELWGVAPATWSYTTAVIIARATLIRDNPDVLADFLRMNAEITDWINKNPEEAQTIAETAITRLTHRAFAPGVFKKAWGRVTFSTDLSLDGLERSAEDATRVGFLPAKPVDFDHLVDLRLLKVTTKSFPRS